jgi:hypothetical protein
MKERMKILTLKDYENNTLEKATELWEMKYSIN